ncbi:uncharacterized protein METZ01_LOCUS433346 [marine metagenome]|uniref:Uncharacterized protein n=1 Tax=marine metagenome TaxID=408172 RepID=A0A382YB15_9ZZZZ
MSFFIESYPEKIIELQEPLLAAITLSGKIFEKQPNIKSTIRWHVSTLPSTAAGFSQLIIDPFLALISIGLNVPEFDNPYGSNKHFIEK